MKAYLKGELIDRGKMRNYYKSWIGALLSLLLLSLSIRGNSQTCEVTLRNDSLIDANNLVVDIYVRATSGVHFTIPRVNIRFHSIQPSPMEEQ